MDNERAKQVESTNGWLSGLPAFPSLAPGDWRKVEASTTEALAALGGRPLPEPIVQALYTRGGLLYERGDDCGAQEIWEALIPHAEALGRSDMAAYCAAWLARGYLNFGEPKEALTWCRRGRHWAKGLPAFHPVHVRLAGTIGTVYQYRREWGKARRALRKALHTAPVDSELTRVWEGMGPDDLEAIQMTMLVDCYLNEATLEGSDDESLALAGRILQAAQETAVTFYTRVHCQFNMMELLWIRGDLDAAETVAGAIGAVLNNPAFPEESRLKFRPPLSRFQSILALSRDNFPMAQKHMREAFRWMRARRNPITEALIVHEMIDLYTAAHRKYYGGFREDTVLSTLEDDGSWILSLVDYCESRSPFLLKGHARKVETACLALMNHLGDPGVEGMPPLLEAAYLRGAALLHDIGLLDVSWALLNRIRPQREADRRRFQAHALAGGRILEQLGFPMTARIAEEHHEYADGSGYPFGTKTQTDIGGVLSLAEALVSSCSPSYAGPEPLTLRQAVESCLGPRSRQFQPRPLEALGRAAESGGLATLENALTQGS